MKTEIHRKVFQDFSEFAVVSCLLPEDVLFFFFLFTFFFDQ